MAIAGTVALTGVTGFIGGHVARRLCADGWRVRALARPARVKRSGAALPGGVTVVAGALEDAASLERLADGADAVVHCAGLVRAARAAAFDAINAGGTARLAAAAAGAAPPRRFVLMSSLAAREPELSAYAASKRDGERALARHGSRLDWTVLRPPAVYGPGDRATLGLFRWFRRGFAPLPAGAAGRVSLIFAEDLAAAVAALLTARSGGGTTFEVRDGCRQGYAWREIAEAASRAMNRRIACVPVPRMAMRALAVANVAAHRAFGGAAMLTPGKLRELYHPDWTCRENPVTAATGWTPEVTIDDGFARTVAWYREQGWL